MSTALDPFKDIETRGYLQNVLNFPLNKIKPFEHSIFMSKLFDALDYLKSRQELDYQDFLSVHGILFGELYPTWAGQDRTVHAPDIIISKGSTKFSPASESRRAVEHGLELARDPNFLKANPGKVMGHFAFAHPFLDGNGRTLLVIHDELCRRAGFSINWSKTSKTTYLKLLSKQIDSEKCNELNDYLKSFIIKPINHKEFADSVKDIEGLDGAVEADSTADEYTYEYVSDTTKTNKQKIK